LISLEGGCGRENATVAVAEKAEVDCWTWGMGLTEKKRSKQQTWKGVEGKRNFYPAEWKLEEKLRQKKKEEGRILDA